MLANGQALSAGKARFPQNTDDACTFAALHCSGIALAGIGFSGTAPDWCEQGFSICESYLIEAQSLFLDGDADGFLAMAEAQSDPELAAEILVHANALLSGMAFRWLGGQLALVDGARPGLNWPALANLWRAMEQTKGDMRMPRLAPAFERRLREALRLS